MFLSHFHTEQDPSGELSTSDPLDDDLSVYKIQINK